MRKKFVSHSRRLSGSIVLNGAVDNVFPLFSPEGERLWVPDWNPELLHPPGASWTTGLIFRTREESGEAVWVVSRLERVTHEVEYYRVEPGRYVAHIEVRCVPDGRRTRATVRYEFIGLSESGNAEIDAMSEPAYAEKMGRWTRWIEAHLAAS